MSEPLKIQVLKTPEGYYLGNDYLCFDPPRPYYCPHRINGGIEIKKSYLAHWYFCSELPTSLECKNSDREVIVGFALVDESISGQSVPLFFKPEEVESSDKCCDGGKEWNEQHKHLRSLYTPVKEIIPGRWEPIEFVLENIGEFTSLNHIGSWSFPGNMVSYDWSDKRQTFITHENVNYYLADKVSAPSIVLGGRPCFLSREHTFQIIREHVRRNIDKRYAKVTSDYDSHIKVEKVITLAEHEEYTINTNLSYSGRKRKPKYEKRYRINRSQPVLSIVPSNKYSYGQPVGQFAGKDLADLKQVIDTFLQELMDEINEPLVECKECQGTGCVLVLVFSSQDKAIKLGSE